MSMVMCIWITSVTVFCCIAISQCTEKCFECHNAPYPRDCAKITLCGTDEFCSVEQVVTTSATILYNTGCMSKSRCQTIGKRDASDSLLKAALELKQRSTDITTCIECCSDNFCNIKGCGTMDIPRIQRGPYCFTCDALDPKACNTVTICADTEECLLMVPPEFLGHPEVVHRGLCESKLACTTVHHVYHDNRCPPMCCGDDFCNIKCGDAINSTQSTPIPQPTHIASVTTTQHVAIQTTHPSAVTPCKAGYYYDHITQLCIRFVDPESSRYTYDAAKTACEATGDRLVIIDSHLKMVFIENTLIHHSTISDPKDQFYWIGLRNVDDSNPFYWINGQPLQYTYWGGHDEVNPNKQPDMTHHQNCVMMYGLDRFMWHDDLCSRHRGYVCENISNTDQSVVTTAQSHAHRCDTSGGYVHLNDANTEMCIHAHRGDKKTWDDARKQCQSERGDLVILDSDAKTTLIKQYVQGKGSHNYWIGAKDFTGNDVFTWANHGSATSGDWAHGEPNHYNGGHIQDCAFMWYSDNFQWHDDNCSNHYNYICQRSM